jgi:hypothetical protein
LVHRETQRTTNERHSQHWLLVRGTGDRPLPDRVAVESLRAHSSTRRPSVQKGDLAVCYASGWQTIFAVAEVVGDPENDPSRERWRWRFPIRPLLALADLREAPPVEAAGVFPSSLGRHSYIRLTPEQFEAAREVLVGAGALKGTVVLVEGLSDQVAIEKLAERRGRDLAAEGVAVLPIGGAQAIARFLDLYGPRGLDLRLAGLCDAGEEREFRRGLERVGFGSQLTRADMEALGFYVCDADLEDELIRALGADAVLAVAEAEGDLVPFRTLQKQPAWRGRPPEEQLRRFMGSGGRRKIRYARLLVEALDLERVPRPLDLVLGRLTAV